MNLLWSVLLALLVLIPTMEDICCGQRDRGFGQGTRMQRQWDRMEKQWDKTEKQEDKTEKSALPESRGPSEAGRIRGLLYQAMGLTREGSTKEQMDKAVLLANEGLRIAKENDIPRGIGRAYMILGFISLCRSEYDKSLEYSKKALEPAKTAGDCTALAAATKNIGNVYKAWGQYDKAVEKFAEALRVAEPCDDKFLIAATLWNLGEVHYYQGRYQDALKVMERGLGISSETKDREIEGYIRTTIGIVYEKIGQYPKAAESLESALKIGEKAKRPRIQQEALNGLGSLYLAWGKYREAADYFRKTLERARRYGEKRTETTALFRQGEVYAKWGRYSDAMVCFQDALSMAKSTGIALHEPLILADMGMLCSARGQYHKAVELYQQALELYRTLGNSHGEGAMLSQLGRVYQTSGQYDQALAHLQEGLEIFRRIGVPTGMINAGIGNLYLDMGEVQKAEPFIKEAGLAASLGRLCLAKTDYQSAKKYYESLLKSAEQNRDAHNLFMAFTGLGTACEGMNDLQGAAEYYRQAVEHTEDLRASLDPAERETFFDVAIGGFYRTAPYEGLARVLLELNRPIEAFKQSEYTRARIFAEAISKGGKYAGLDVPANVREADFSLANQLASLTQNLQKAYEEQNRDAIASLEPQVKEAKENLAAHIQMLRKEYPLFSATRYPQPMDLGQTALKTDEWVLEYHVTDPGLIIYLSEGKNLTKYLFRQIRRKEIDDLVRKFRDPLEMRPGDDIIDKLESFDFATGKQLTDLLLSVVLPWLPKGRALTIVPDDSLGALPFEMLPLNTSGKIKTDRELPYTFAAEFLGDRNPISYYQSVTALTLARTYGKQKGPGGKLLVFADPVFQTKDARYREHQEKAHVAAVEASLYEEQMSVMGEGSANGGGLSRLPLTAALADNLVKMHGGNAECYTGLQASKERFLKKVAPGLVNYSSIVFATHGYFGKDLPGIKEPVLVLTLVPPGTDGFLRMSEVASLTMNADLVALTACQTGLGKKISGEGTMGMGRAFQYAGAKCVLTSLWSVEQTASVNLVQSLFKHVKEGKTKLEALGLARQEVRKKGFDHPFFWASFILVGETN